MSKKIDDLLIKVGAGNVPFPTKEPDEDGSAEYQFPRTTKTIRKVAWWMYNKKNPPLSPELSDEEAKEISCKPLDPKDFI